MTRDKKNSTNPNLSRDQQNETSNGIKMPSISLPKGGGAIKGIDEKFEVNATNGTANIAIGLPLSPARNGFTPSVGLGYSSGGGNSPFGLGWELGVPSISRKTDRGIPRYRKDEEDTYVLTGDEDLILYLKETAPGNWEHEIKTTADQYTVKRYRPRIEGDFSRIEKITHADHGAYWKITSNGNIVTIYGRNNEARINDPDDTNKIFQWYAEFSYDDKGNWIKYSYKPENLDSVRNLIYEQNRLEGRMKFANLYLKRIKYGNQQPYYADKDKPYDPVDPTLIIDSQEERHFFDVVFDYGEHDALVPTIDELVDQKWECRQDPFSTRRPGFEIRTYRLCKRVLMFHNFDELGEDPCLVKSLALTYEPSSINNSGQSEVTYLTAATLSGYIKVEEGYSKKSFPAVTYTYQKLEWNRDIQTIDIENSANAPVGLTNSYNWVDLYGEGISGILSEQGDAWYYKENLGDFNQEGAQFTPATKVVETPSLKGVYKGNLVLQDLEANGQRQLAVTSKGMNGFYEINTQTIPEMELEPFKAFESFPNIDLADRNTRLIDLTGNGVADIVITTEDAFLWYAGIGKEGYSPAESALKAIDEKEGPALVFANREESIFLADMTGDGLTDIVRIRNGEISYWSNLGYGHFSAKITMGNAPLFDYPDSYDPDLIQIADISGTGVMDLVYLGQNSFKAYLNHSGNAWSTPFEIDPFVQLDNHGRFSVIDLLGTGTSCLVWSTDLPSQFPMRYIDLMHSRKPHLLIAYKNNTGQEVEIEYKSSTYFYLKDKREGNPWITKLPFPVQVISKTKSTDKISETVFTSSYSYKHGYFDYDEREFRGFARVEQYDTEDFNQFKLNAAKNVVEEELHQAPVKTITWFHTGAFVDREKMLHQLKQEYFVNPVFAELEFAELPVKGNLSHEELIEATRALKGTPLHMEIYSDDGTAKSAYPFSSNSASFEVKLIQPKENNKHASFQTVRVEHISFGYDRNPNDPRIKHSFVLETDEFSNPLKSASVIYPRVNRPIGTDAIPDRVWNDQNKLHMIYGEADFTNDIEENYAYRLRTAYESRGYEVNGIVQPAEFYFNKTDLFNQIKAATTIDYEVDFSGGVEQRLTSHSRSYYMKDDLSGSLPLGELSELGIGFNSHQLAFTKNLVSKYYGAKVNDAMLIDAKYVHSEGDEHWWTQEGTVIYDPNPKDNFYLPIGGADVYGNSGSIIYDSYFLLTISTTNALGHTASVTNDYRTLDPIMQIDPNLNRSMIETDELGVVIKAAIMGKEGAGEGDSIDNPTSKIEYDLFNWQNNQKPNFVHTFTREEHGTLDPIWQEAYVYFDGGGSPIMQKAQVAPGKAKQWNDVTKEVVEVDADPRWIGNGRTIFNNKGNPIKSYEPFFSTTHEYESEDALVETGFTSILFYDSAGRNIKTELPNGTFTKSEYNAWYGKSYDVNDTVKDSAWYSDRGSPDPLLDPEPVDVEERAAWLAAKHHETPSTGHANNLGRVTYTVTDYGDGKTTAVFSEQDLASRYSKVYDQMGRLVSEGYSNLLKTPIYGKSAEKGERWTFIDVMGRPVRIWDNAQFEMRMAFDELHRPVSTYVEQDGVEVLFSHVVYGDVLADPVSENLVGKAYQLYDQSGVITMKNTDFKGNVTELDRTLCKEYKQLVNWQVLEGLTNIAAIEAAALPLLENETFTFLTEVDALNRPTLTTLPDGSVFRPTYDEGNQLTTFAVKVRGIGSFETYLEEQDYNAKGERQYVKLGNGLITSYFHDPKTFRLLNMITKVDGDADIDSIQNLHYTFDPIGNIVYTKDDAQQTHYFRNAVVKAESAFEYDAIYQLIKATGREHAIVQNPQPNHQSIPFLSELPQINNANAVRNYTQTYEYDDLGNLRQMKHVALNGDWTRRYHYAYESDPLDLTNRLASTSQPTDPVGGPYSDQYTYDQHGNMTQMSHLNELVWNFMDQLSEVDLGGGGKAYYVYDIGGKRTRKVIERIGGKRLERIYLGSIEIYREYQGLNKNLERNTLHISDNTGKIAQVDTKLLDVNNTDVSNPLNVDLIRYQHGNHLGSASVETDENGSVISYEEYHPFGTSSYRNSKSGTNLSLKRYRYTGQEKDDETGLYQMGARYYAPWLGRWTSSDPAGFVDGFNLYRYSRNNPVMLSDPSGNAPKKSDDRVLGTTPQHVLDVLHTNTDAARQIIDSHFTIGSIVIGRRGSYRITGGSFWNGTENLLRWTEITTSNSGGNNSSGNNSGGNSAGGNNNGGGVVLPVRPAIQPTPVPSVGLTPTSPVPRYDLQQAPPGTNFRAAESAGRTALRRSVPHATGEQAQHNLKWRIGRRLNLHPSITNDPRYMNPLQSRNALSNGPYMANGRRFNNPHTWADRGLYPQYEREVRAQIGSHSSERVIHLETGRRVQQRTTNQSGPPASANPYSTAPRLIWRPRFMGIAGQSTLTMARGFIPGIVELEVLFGTGAMYAYAAGYTTIGAGLTYAAAYTPVIGASLVAGAFAGNVVEYGARRLGASDEVATGLGVLGSVGAGAGVGALIGSVIPIVGTGVGAGVGAVAGLIGYGISKLF